MPSAKVIPYYTYTDYLHWEGRWELIEGLPYAMSPTPSPYHQYIVGELIYAFKKAIRAANCKKCKVYDFIDIKINEDTIVQPDMVILCKPILKHFLDFPATLIIEILSPATALKDRNNKFSIYEKFEIKYYVIVDPDVQKIEVYELNEQKQYELQKLDGLDQVTFDFEGCGVEVNLAEVFE